MLASRLCAIVAVGTIVTGSDWQACRDSSSIAHDRQAGHEEPVCISLT